MKKIISIMLCVFTALSLFACTSDKEKYPENYEIDSDRIPSFTFVVGDREIKSSKIDSDAKTLKYTYKTDEETYMDVYEYMSYLIDNCGGVVTRALNEGEDGSCEIALPSDESGYIITLSFDYKPKECRVTVKRFAGKIEAK